jgi:ketosteroid isomerase-like protein
LCDGANWSIRWTFSGDRPDGSRFSAEGASAGRLAQDGRVIEHTDYWNRAGIQGGA